MFNTTKKGNSKGRKELADWEQEINENAYAEDHDFRHSISFHSPETFSELDPKLSSFSNVVIREITPLVQKNNLPQNLPSISKYDSIGQVAEKIIHHPSYEAIGNLIYGSGLMERMSIRGSLMEGLSFLFLSSYAGEAGHNCPIACSAGIIRVLQKIEDFPERNYYLRKLIAPSYTDNYTGAQFITEIQGGSDAGINAAEANKDEQGNWRITGEKWFCSNANADLILMTARHNPSLEGTKGLGLFLVPAKLHNREANRYSFRRLKDKIGTRSMATAEIDFYGAFAIPMGPLEEGFKILMENVIHLSRLFNSVCVLGMGRRAFQIAQSYARHRNAFGYPLITYPLVKENLARIKSENTALIAAIFATIKLQDAHDITDQDDTKAKLLLRLLANINKYQSAFFSFEHIHHCIDMLAGNGTIETFSLLPLLLRDCLICENWEGTHNVLRMQVLRDILRYQIDEIFLEYIHSLIHQMDSNIPEKEILVKYALNLRKDLEEFKKESADVQMFQIRSIMDKMGSLLCAIHLFLEAIDQLKTGNSSKKHCFDYFSYLHLQSQENKRDKFHLTLIKEMFSE